MLLTLVIFTALTRESFAKLSWTETYPYTTNLDAGGHAYLAWKNDEYYVTMELQVKSTGWIGVGISHNRGMRGADIFVGWVKGGKATITDRHGIGNEFPPKDEEQNVELLHGKEEGGWTLLKFRRTIKTCIENDLSISRDIMEVIYAWGRRDPEGDDIVPADKHTFKGSKSIILLGHLSREATAYPEGERHETFSVTSGGVKLPPKETYYMCRLVSYPQVSGKRHIVAVEPWIQSGHERYVHHIVLYQCTSPIPTRSLVNESGECMTPSSPIDMQKCFQPVSAWDEGNEVHRFPKEIGFPFGGSEDPKYLLLEIHYHNPFKLDSIVDDSGFRITYTSDLRQHDAGTFSMGRVQSGLTTMIPPGAASFPLTGTCGAKCIADAMDNANVEEIRVMAVKSHTHNLGRDVTIRHFRGEEELPYLTNDKTDDFNKHLHYVEEEIVVKKGDTLQAVCEYSSMGRENFTYGGLAVMDEMCVVYAFYYPRIPLSSCQSQETVDGMTKILSNYGVDSQSLTPKPTVFRGQSWKTIRDTTAGKTVNQILNEYTWNETSIELLNQRMASSRIMLFCTTPSGRAASFSDPMVVKNPYIPPPKVCNVTIEVDPGNGAKHHMPSYALMLMYTFILWLML